MMMADDDTPDEGGLEPAEESEETTDAALDTLEEEAPAPAETYTREQLAELLPHFDRVASHEGAEAVRQYGQMLDNARRFISTGGHLTPQPEDAYRAAGLDPSEVQIPDAEPEEEAPGLWGTPWQRPTTYDEVVQYAQSEDADARRLAWEAVASDPTTPDHVNRWYFSNWAQLDPAGATLYNQQAAQRTIDERLEQLEERLAAKYEAATQDLRSRNASALLTMADTQIPGFREHAASVEALFNERCADDQAFADRIMNHSTMEQQLRELRRLTIIAAAEAAPEREAKKKQAEAATDAAKLSSQTETGRTNGAPETEQQAMKRKSLEDARRVGGRIY